MKEPLKEVPNELIEELDWYDVQHLAHYPVADALRNLIEDWKRLKEEEKENRSVLQQKLDRIERLVSEGCYTDDESLRLIRDIFDE